MRLSKSLIVGALVYPNVLAIVAPNGMYHKHLYQLFGFKTIGDAQTGLANLFIGHNARRGLHKRGNGQYTSFILYTSL